MKMGVLADRVSPIRVALRVVTQIAEKERHESVLADRVLLIHASDRATFNEF